MFLIWGSLPEHAKQHDVPFSGDWRVVHDGVVCRHEDGGKAGVVDCSLVESAELIRVCDYMMFLCSQGKGQQRIGHDDEGSGPDGDHGVRLAGLGEGHGEEHEHRKQEYDVIDLAEIGPDEVCIASQANQANDRCDADKDQTQAVHTRPSVIVEQSGRGSEQGGQARHLSVRHLARHRVDMTS